MPIRFNCEYCGSFLRFEDSLAGKTISCPWCGEILEIPKDDQPEVPIENFSIEQQSLIAKYPSTREYLRPPGEGFQEDPEDDASET